MDEAKGHMCPECGAPRGPDNTPSCACTQRASDALRDARTAEAAAAEDFDPLRIRPYVDLDAEAVGDETEQLPAVEVTMALHPVAPQAPAPSTDDLRMFEADASASGDEDEEGASRLPRRRTVVLGVGGGLVAVVAAAGFASGLFTYETPSRAAAPPKDVRAAVPEASTSAVSVSPSSSRTSARTASAQPAPSRSVSPSAPASSASSTPSRSTSPTASPTTASATGTVEPGNGRESEDLVLREGDRGDEVVELQLRLKQVYLYNGEADGKFTTEVEDALRNYQWSRSVDTDDLGVYDAPSREKLEAETTEP